MGPNRVWWVLMGSGGVLMGPKGVEGVLMGS